MGRDFKEHQINIFAVPFGEIGFSLPHKQAILEEFIEHDKEHYPNKSYSPCVGRKKLKKQKPKDSRESDEKLDDRLKGRHKVGLPAYPKSHAKVMGI